MPQRQFEMVAHEIEQALPVQFAVQSADQVRDVGPVEAIMLGDVRLGGNEGFGG
jgi:hypothetical protein